MIPMPGFSGYRARCIEFDLYQVNLYNHTFRAKDEDHMLRNFLSLFFSTS